MRSPSSKLSQISKSDIFLTKTPKNTNTLLHGINSPSIRQIHKSNNDHEILNSKVIMLNSASSRLKHQQDSLRGMLDSDFETNVINKFEQFIDNMDKTSQRIEILKQEVENTHKQQTNDNSTAQLQKRIKILKQQLKLIKKTKITNIPNLNNNYQSQLNKYYSQYMRQINDIHRNTQQIITNTINSQNQHTKNRICLKINAKLQSHQIKSHWNDLQTDLGELLCEIAYLQRSQNQEYQEHISTSDQIITKQKIIDTCDRIQYQLVHYQATISVIKQCIIAHNNIKQTHKQHVCCLNHNYQKSPKIKLAVSDIINNYRPQKKQQNFKQSLSKIRQIQKQLQRQCNGLYFQWHIYSQKQQKQQIREDKSNSKTIQRINQINMKIMKTKQSVQQLQVLYQNYEQN